MSSDRTLPQSPDEQSRAKDLSLARTKPPAEAPGYEVQTFLGTGAYGEVWLGIDRKTGRRVAVKYFTHRGGIDWPMLSREVEKLVFLSADRYVVQLLDVGWEAEPPYYVMEYIANGSLDDYLRERGRLPLSQATAIFREVATGLVRAHGKGVLHCDLKPANVLLDPENKPVLADFGQSRLTSDQRPSLGTLFYMAPEQARLDSIPDTQWDVYALGALYYCMLTGQPPYRTEEAIRALDSASDLVERLARYRRLLESAPRATAHRRVRGVDRSLAEIIDRCLAREPAERYPNVQSVLDALQARSTARSRLPLRLLGLVGPVLILIIASLFGLRGYRYALRDSEAFMSQRVGESNQFAAKFAARSIESEIARYFRVVNRESEDEELVKLLAQVADIPTLAKLNHYMLPVEEREPVRMEFLDDPVRLSLHAYLQERLHAFRQRAQADPTEPRFASIFAIDALGTMMAVAYASEFETRSVGRNYAWRSYFHGGPADLSPKVRVPAIQPITQTQLSGAFLSTTSGTWKVAVTTPVYDTSGDSERLLGLLAMTIDLGDFSYFRSNQSRDRFAVLIDGREGPNLGTILQHPLFHETGGANGPLTHVSSSGFRLSPDDLKRIFNQGDFTYHDPLARAPGGEGLAEVWIAAGEVVRLPDAPNESDDLLVLVQERQSAATAPVQQLGHRLVREAILALSGILAVVGTLWYFVLRLLEA